MKPTVKTDKVSLGVERCILLSHGFATVKVTGQESSVISKIAKEKVPAVTEFTEAADPGSRSKPSNGFRRTILSY